DLFDNCEVHAFRCDDFLRRGDERFASRHLAPFAAREALRPCSGSVTDRALDDGLVLMCGVLDGPRTTNVIPVGKGLFHAVPCSEARPEPLCRDRSVWIESDAQPVLQV